MPPFIPLLLFLALVGALLNAGFLVTLAYFLMAIFLFVRWWMQRVPEVLSYRRVHETHLFFDETATVTLEVHNRSMIPIPWLQYSERLPLRLGYTTATYRRRLYPGARGAQAAVCSAGQPTRSL